MSLHWEGLNFKTDEGSIKKLFASCCSSSWCNLKSKSIFENLNGFISRGELVALMGPSGAGKSTLLNCITRGEKHEGCSGKITVYNINETLRANFICQDEKEHLFMTLTVSQSLKYASRLKNPSSTSNKVHDKIVSQLISELELEGTENTIVDKCSGGQRKRLAIALELTALAKPQFLFLDEVTSGLDSCVGLKVMELLSRLAVKHNMAILATIHQPSFKLFSVFTRAYIMSGAGEFIFNGCPKDLKKFLGDCGYDGGEQSSNDNPADIAMEMASAINRNTKQLNLEGNNNNIVQIDVDQYNMTICAQMTQTLKLQQVKLPSQEDGGIEVQKNGLLKNGSSFGFYSLWILFLRSLHTSIWNDKKFIMIRFSLHFVVAGGLAALYNRHMGMVDGCLPVQDIPSQGRNSSIGEEIDGEVDTAENIGFHFFSLLFLMFAAMMPTVLTFPAEIKLFLNEYRNGYYSSSSYYISKTITEIPLQFLFPYFYMYFLYWFSQQPGMDKWCGGFVGCMSSTYVNFIIVTILCCFTAQGFGFLIGIICVRSYNISIIIACSTLIFLFLCSGFFVKRVLMNVYIRWITYFSFIRYGFEALLVTIYSQERCETNYESSVLVNFGLNDDDYLYDIAFLIGHLLIVRLAAFIMLNLKANPTSLWFRFRKLFLMFKK